MPIKGENKTKHKHTYLKKLSLFGLLYVVNVETSSCILRFSFKITSHFEGKAKNLSNKWLSCFTISLLVASVQFMTMIQYLNAKCRNALGVALSLIDDLPIWKGWCRHTPWGPFFSRTSGFTIITTPFEPLPIFPVPDCLYLCFV